MHDWKIIASPWPGVRIVRCTECGWEARRVGRQDIPSFVAANGRPMAACPRVRQVYEPADSQRYYPAAAVLTAVPTH
jgi:hypothetical protein